MGTTSPFAGGEDGFASKPTGDRRTEKGGKGVDMDEGFGSSFVFVDIPFELVG